MFPEIMLHIDSVKNHMANEGIEAILVGSNSNIYYTSGRFYRGYVFIPLSGTPLWFVIKPDFYEPQPNVFQIRKPEMIPDILTSLNYETPKSVGYEFDVLSYSDVMRLRRLFPDAEPKNGSSPLRKARMIKTEWEISEMKKDGVHQANAYSKIKDCYRKGMTDLEFQIEIEKVLRLEGALGVTRTAGNLMDINLGSVISGDNADVPGPYDFTMGGSGVDSSLPVGAAGNVMKEGETVMIDMNGAFNGYQTDMTRVWSLGDIPEIALKAHQCSIEILHRLEKISLPETPVASLYNEAMKIVAEFGLENYFMGHQSHVSFIGHGVGIELNEPPVVMAKSKDILDENMTIALEPKFVIPKVGAVGVENTYRVTTEGLESLTVFPEEIKSL